MMIDVHCHLEQKNYDHDREKVIELCKNELDAVVTTCAHPKDFDLTMQMVDKHRNFIFAATSIHPEYVKDITEVQKEDYIQMIKRNKEKITAIGETGTDYWWIKDGEWRIKQRELFIEMIDLADSLRLPLVIHSRNSRESKKAIQDAIDTLEESNANRVQMHMYSSRRWLNRVLKNDWMISVNTLLLRSKGIRKIVRDTPLNQLMLETDAPWLAVGEDGKIKKPAQKRNLPTAVKQVAEKIAEIKKTTIEEVDAVTTDSAKNFFNMKK
jgi:TatD DNase family protein